MSAAGPVLGATAVALAVVVSVSTGVAQDPNADWSQHNFDTTNRRYAPLDQIDVATAGRLELAWSFEVGGASSVAQVTPLVVDGVMYLHSLSQLMASDATSGAPIWTNDMDPSGSGPVRGPTYADGRIYAYTGSSLYALDARTGDRLDTFGDDGVLAVVGVALQFKYPDVFPPTLDPVTIGYRLTTPPAYPDETLYVAAALSEGHIPGDRDQRQHR